MFCRFYQRWRVSNCWGFGQYVSNELGDVWDSYVAGLKMGKETEILRKSTIKLRVEESVER